MKLSFDPNLDYQWDAVKAVCDLFRGQEINRTEFTVTARDETAPDLRASTVPEYDPGLSFQWDLGLDEGELGIGNRLSLGEADILRNLNAVQLRNGLPPSESLDSFEFTVEMETGTGKTYVYLRTIFELNRVFGFTKFVIVVPSIAIKEGVYKTLHITEEHFKSLYSGQPFDYFLYDSAKLGLIRNFATSPTIQIMVITVGAINKKAVNNLYKDSEKTGGEVPVDLIRATRPVVIVDEPQSVDGGLQGRGREALTSMNPLCTLRYSATHVDKHHMVYRLDAVDAYDRKLVKQIEVASLVVEGGHNSAYLRFLAATNPRRRAVTASVEVDALRNSRVRRTNMSVMDGDDLEQLTGREIYRGYRVGEIRPAGAESLLEVKVPGSEEFLGVGQSIGGADPDGIKRLMIRRAIYEHLQKEARLSRSGVKVLTLFFIDAVRHYRSYDSDGNYVKGKYATFFEEELIRASKLSEFAGSFKNLNMDAEVGTFHDGYFSVDRSRRWADTSENNQANRDNAERAYNLIMRDKERLLSFDTRLQFIFSHSALREGWDNPNIFQICTLREIGTELERRQTLGRGLRLCVNQQGDRLHDPETNILTVIATEPYEEFAENLQKEIEQETGIRFGMVDRFQFAAIVRFEYDGSATRLGFEESSRLFEYFRENGLIDAEGVVQNELRRALNDDALVVPKEYDSQLPQIKEVLRKIAGKFQIKDADERIKIKTRQAILDSPEFQELWDRIKHKTTYRLNFDNEKLIAECVKAIEKWPPIPRASVVVQKAGIRINEGGVVATGTGTSGPNYVDDGVRILPDLLTDLQYRTKLTRRSLVQILILSGRLNDFRRNPQSFIDVAANVINRTKRLVLVDGIKYKRLGDRDVYAQELFQQQELIGYMKDMLFDTRKSVFEHVVYDSSTIERPFAEQLEKHEWVKVYAKLPRWFKVPTPLGSYNPDWAVVVQTDEGERLYFVVETKPSQFDPDLRSSETAKIQCGKAHFDALEGEDSPTRYEVATSLSELFANANRP